MNLVVDNTAIQTDTSDSGFLKTEMETSDAIFVIQITEIETYESNVLSRFTYDKYFKTREEANARVAQLQQLSSNRLYFVQPLWPDSHTGPKMTIVN